MLHVTIRSSSTPLHEIDYVTHIHAFQTYAEFLCSREGLRKFQARKVLLARGSNIFCMLDE